MPKVSCVGFFLQKSGEAGALGNLGLQELVRERQGIAVFHISMILSPPSLDLGMGKTF